MCYATDPHIYSAYAHPLPHSIIKYNLFTSKFPQNMLSRFYRVVSQFNITLIKHIQFGSL